VGTINFFVGNVGFLSSWKTEHGVLNQENKNVLLNVGPALPREGCPKSEENFLQEREGAEFDLEKDRECL